MADELQPRRENNWPTVWFLSCVLMAMTAGTALVVLSILLLVDYRRAIAHDCKAVVQPTSTIYKRSQPSHNAAPGQTWILHNAISGFKEPLVEFPDHISNQRMCDSFKAAGPSRCTPLSMRDTLCECVTPANFDHKCWINHDKLENTDRYLRQMDSRLDCKFDQKSSRVLNCQCMELQPMDTSAKTVEAKLWAVLGGHLKNGKPTGSLPSERYTLGKRHLSANQEAESLGDLDQKGALVLRSPSDFTPRSNKYLDVLLCIPPLPARYLLEMRRDCTKTLVEMLRYSPLQVRDKAPSVPKTPISKVLREFTAIGASQQFDDLLLTSSAWSELKLELVPCGTTKYATQDYCVAGSKRSFYESIIEFRGSQSTLPKAARPSKAQGTSGISSRTQITPSKVAMFKRFWTGSAVKRCIQNCKEYNEERDEQSKEASKANKIPAKRSDIEAAIPMIDLNPSFHQILHNNTQCPRNSNDSQALNRYCQNQAKGEVKALRNLAIILLAAATLAGLAVLAGILLTRKKRDLQKNPPRYPSRKLQKAKFDLNQSSTTTGNALARPSIQSTTPLTNINPTILEEVDESAPPSPPPATPGPPPWYERFPNPFSGKHSSLRKRKHTVSLARRPATDGSDDHTLVLSDADADAAERGMHLGPIPSSPAFGGVPLTSSHLAHSDDQISDGYLGVSQILERQPSTGSAVRSASGEVTDWRAGKSRISKAPTGLRLERIRAAKKEVQFEGEKQRVVEERSVSTGAQHLAGGQERARGRSGRGSEPWA
ncbi:MAG: hypothetical protein M1814_003042 [Vezdaea aestivalis]|nr:MAG: hypothetical protein M1814_003042 [Vezdaea aestivalis]